MFYKIIMTHVKATKVEVIMTRPYPQIIMVINLNIKSDANKLPIQYISNTYISPLAADGPDAVARAYETLKHAQLKHITI